MYKVKEIYYTLQGEGFHSGKAAIFCRFSGCNLWSGREEDRSDAVCQFCDTDFWGIDGVNGGRYSAEKLAKKCNELWPRTKSEKFVVFTGGEPLLQLDNDLLGYFKKLDFFTAVETNGTLPCPNLIDWICVSPKEGTEIALQTGNEIKVVHPQGDSDPSKYDDLQFHHYYIQPKDCAQLQENTNVCIDFCLQNPKWKLSLQTHKLIGID